jgi:hypothetical protein
MTASVPTRVSVMQAPLDIAGGSIYDNAPDAVADDLGWETVILVAVVGCWCVHAASMPHLRAARQGDNAHLLPGIGGQVWPVC